MPATFKDINPLSGSGLTQFKNSLHPDAFIKIWGCAEQMYQHNDGAPIRKLVTDYAETRTEQTQRRAQLMQSYLAFVAQCFPFLLPRRLIFLCGPGRWSGSDFNDVDGKFKKATYAANKMTYRGYFPPDLDRGELWWRVSKNFRSNRNITNTFFKKALGARLDPVGYVEYQASWFNAALKAVNDDLAGAQSTPGMDTLSLLDGSLDFEKAFGDQDV